ncbi:tRNA(Met) cytidine acetyltransferase TmcA, partial [Endothiovibrio diazotrophicus]
MTSLHRHLVVVQGRPADTRPIAERLLRTASAEADTLWIGDAPPHGIRGAPPAKFHRLLGDECGVLLFDAHQAFDPDAFGAAAGTLRGGGTLLLLIPPSEDWNTPFLQRLLRQLRGADGVRWIGAHDPPPSISVVAPAADRGTTPTDEQIQVVEAIARVVHGHRRRPLVVTADRGRGKSAALGMAAARLLADGVERVVVTAPRTDAAAALFAHAADGLHGCVTTRGRIEWQGRSIEFLAPDRLIEEPADCRLLLVDEAAAIPAPLLHRLLERHARIVFATTVHGYEGSGRGFAIRFRATLDRLTPGWRERRLEAPVRWGADDPLERLTFRLLCLDAAPVDDAALAATPPERVTIEPLQAQRLAADEATLRQLFGLLVSAHYRTTPGDLQQLLDDPAVSLWIARAPSGIVGVALVIDEGGFDAVTARAIFEGRRRPRGHLLAQSLSLHGGIEEAPLRRFARVRRIAVHPALRGHGIGRRLVEAAAVEAGHRGRDALGASFGVDPDLLRFWDVCDLRPVHLGFTRDHAGGAHSAMVLRPLNEAGRALTEAARRRFGEGLPLLLGGPLRDLDPALAVALLRRLPVPEAPTAAERRETEAVAHAARGVDASLGALRAVLLSALASDGAIGEAGSALAVARLIQQREWEDCARRFGLSGKREAIAALRAAFRHLLARAG